MDANAQITPFSHIIAGIDYMGRGAHFRNNLTDRQVKAIKPTERVQRIGDGAGLYLVIDQAGAKGTAAKRWQCRVTVRSFEGGRGQAVVIGLGNVRDVSLAAARERAQLYRTIAREGRDPRTVRVDRDRDGRLVVVDWHPGTTRQTRRNNPTFATAFEEFAEFRRKGLTSEKFAGQWQRDVERHAYPVIADQHVADIGPAEISATLAPIWHDTADTARKVAQRLAGFFEYAIGRDWHGGPNPVPIARAGLGKQSDVVQHRPALNWQDAPAFYRSIDELHCEESTKLALRALMLTAARSIEVRCATWPEIDLQARTWARPAEHMKARRAHVVPVTDGLAVVLEHAAAMFGRRGLIFPGRWPGRPMSDSTLSRTLGRAGHHGKVTVHGMRSTFRVWAGETGADEIAAEHQLAHEVGGKVERAYARSDLLDRRRVLMAAWDAFLTAE